MTAEFESLVLEHLRAIRGDVADIKDRIGRVELGLSTIEGSLDRALSDADPVVGLGLIRRVAHINGRWN